VKVVVLHNVNGATKVAAFEAPNIAAQLVTAGVAVHLLDPDGREIGFGHFHRHGIVTLGGDAIRQYPARATAEQPTTEGEPDV
jgi:hypothetical protein